MSDQRIFVSEGLSDRDDSLCASPAKSSATAPREDAMMLHRLRNDRLKPNNRWRAFLEKRKA